jgi:hypothetical protein
METFSLEFLVGERDGVASLKLLTKEREWNLSPIDVTEKWRC